MQSIAIQIARLPSHSLGELQSLWNKYFDTPAKSQNKEFYVQRIAYRIQELAYGGIPQKQQQLIASYYEPCEERNKLPPQGTRLIREYLGVEHSVIVLNDGFEFNGMKFSTLSAIAKRITGHKVSGRHFFGLDKN